jgi:NAD(P)-dependent dehydrogenase (short-subunit alcohol dehydrogenase family)
MPPLLAGRTAVVTGAAAGLGAEMARVFEAAGARAVRLDVAAGPGVAFCDVTDEDSVRRALAEAAEASGRLDVVVANAGLVPPWRATEDYDLAEWDRVLAVNVRGVAATFKHAVPWMKDRGGALIATSSIMGYRAHPGQALYVASKHAVAGLVKAAALDLGRHGIRVNAIGPGSVATDALVGRMTRRAAAGGMAVEDALFAAANETALKRMVSAEDVAKTVLYLASDLASGVTGQLVPVEGGLA